MAMLVGSIRRIDDDAAAAVPGLLNFVDEHALVVGLYADAFQPCLPAGLLRQGYQILVGLPAIYFGSRKPSRFIFGPFNPEFSYHALL